MEWYFVGAGLLLLLLVFIAIGLPIPFALAAASLPFLLQVQGLSTSLITSSLKLWGVWVDYILLAVPLFVFLGELIGRSSIGPNLYRILHDGVRVRGSAAYGSIGACAGFGAVCGSSMVGALTIGGIALPEMIKLGYDRRLASGVLAAGGTLSVLIPPSLIMLFYGIVTDKSIGELFIAGVIPGIILTLLFAAVVQTWAKMRPDDVPKGKRGGKIAPSLIFASVGPVIAIGIVITSSIYLGIATPTEAAAVAAILTIVLAFAVGGLTIRGFWEALKATMRTMGFLGLLLSAGALFGFVLTYYRVPQQFTEAFLALEFSPYAVLAFVLIFYIALGMFLEPVSMTFITLPTLFPLVHAAGFDPIWFGVIYTITMEIAVLTPPVGLNLYVIQGIARDDVSIGDVIFGCLPFIAALVLMIALLIIEPRIALWASRRDGLTMKFPLALIHGYLGDAEQWRPQISAFKRDYKIIAPTLPGFGANANLSAPSSIGEFADFVLRHLSREKIRRFHLLGHSMGGMIAQEIARQSPSRVAGLILYATGPQGKIPGRFESLAQSRRRVLSEGASASAERIAATWTVGGKNSPAYPLLSRIAKQAGADAQLAGLRAMESWDGRDHLPHITNPTLIIWGTRDCSYSFNQIQKLWRGIPNADLAVIPGAGHAAHLEKPDIFNRLVGDFLSEIKI